MDQSQLLNAITDPTTGLFIRPYFELRLEEEFKKAMRYGWVESLLLMDVHGLDELAEMAGDDAVTTTWLHIANGILTNTRDVDLPGLIGPNRVAILLPGTEMDGARTMVERVMGGILDGAPEVLSLDAGISEAPRADLQSCEEFLARATAALQLAARQGRNQLVGWNAGS